MPRSSKLALELCLELGFYPSIDFKIDLTWIIRARPRPCDTGDRQAQDKAPDQGGFPSKGRSKASQVREKRIGRMNATTIVDYQSLVGIRYSHQNCTQQRTQEAEFNSGGDPRMPTPPGQCALHRSPRLRLNGFSPLKPS